MAVSTAAVVIMCAVPLVFQTMRTAGGNCGTVWASSETWTFTSTYDGPSGYFGGGRSPESSKRAAISGWWANMERGADVFEACEDLHHDRRILLLTMGAMATILLGVGIAAWRADRRRHP
ncbi:hypothetical protein [Prescottella subtropica]|uniref:hypothetical protein n=1 Tax=Prescottella subtropica TaxID=2545757 RepID=UPI0010F46736|nr:hypothetical protein [Prescottella subtropica]